MSQTHHDWKKPQSSQGSFSNQQISNRASRHKRQIGTGQNDVLEISEIIEMCNTNCQLIASQAEYLHRMRSRCVTTAKLTQNEIRDVEEKLVKLFSLQLITKQKVPFGTPIPVEFESFPLFRQWLEVVGLNRKVIDMMCSEISQLENLLEKNDKDIHILMNKCGATAVEILKLMRACGNLKKYTEFQHEGKENEFIGNLYWDSWEQSVNINPITVQNRRHRPQRTSVSSSEGDTLSHGLTETHSDSSQSGNHPESCPSSQSSSGIGLSSKGSDSSNPSSPPFVIPSNTFSSIPPPSPGAVTTLISSLTQHSFAFQHDSRSTPPSTPPIGTRSGAKTGDKKFLPTPPPNRKNLLQNTLKSQLQQQHGSNGQSPSSIGRSASHESQLTLSTEQLAPRRTRLQSDSGAESVMCSDVNRSPDLVFHTKDDAIFNPVPESGLDPPEQNSRFKYPGPFSNKFSSPKRGYRYGNRMRGKYLLHGNNSKLSRQINLSGLSGSMVHNVHHRFTIALKPDKCGFCHQKFPLLGGLKCKECNFKCHRECESKIAPSCGLPRELLEVFAQKLKRDLEQSSRGSGSPPPVYLTSSDSLHRNVISSSQPAINNFLDSSSNPSSSNSSSPSSPALIIPNSSPSKPTFIYTESTIRGIHQHSSDIPVDMKPWLSYEPPSPICSVMSSNNVVDSRQSHDSDKTVSTTSGSGSTGTDDSDRTVANHRFDSQDSTVSESDFNDPKCTRQNSASSVSRGLREWEIPYIELVRGEVIGRGRFGIVYSGNWHGQVAIKELHMDYVNDEKTLDNFKAEVGTFRKTRHENLVLFMGACMKPPRLAIVTSLCKGMTLYSHIHILKDKFTMSRTIPVAQQIAQGMGYLHARGIVHKDLKTKNIFLESGRVVITDFGLFSVTRLCCDTRRGSWLTIPPGWLCYLAPEVLRAIKLNPRPEDLLPFTTYSDVYAFGTVWYELLCGEWPYMSLPPESVIWQVGRGIKPSLAHLHASKDVKEILMACWSYRPDQRQEFSDLLKLLTRLPKKRLARSPSHPVQLSRSAESVF